MFHHVRTAGAHTILHNPWPKIGIETIQAKSSQHRVNARDPKHQLWPQETSDFHKMFINFLGRFAPNSAPSRSSIRGPCLVLGWSSSAVPLPSQVEMFAPPYLGAGPVIRRRSGVQFQSLIVFHRWPTQMAECSQNLGATNFCQRAKGKLAPAEPMETANHPAMHQICSDRSPDRFV